MADDKPAIAKVHPKLFNHAHPDLVLADYPCGAHLEIQGLGKPPALRIKLPNPPTAAIARVGTELREVQLPVDGVFLWTDAAKLVPT